MSGSDVTTYRAGIFGQSGTGKSTLTHALCCVVRRPWLLDCQRNLPRPPGPGVRHFRPALGAHREDTNKGGRFFSELDALCRSAALAGDCTVVVDDANTCVRRGQIVPQSSLDILNEGRHMPYERRATGVGFIANARRPKELPTDWIAQFQHLFVFRFALRNDLEWCSDTGFDPDQIRQLPTGHFVHWDNASGQPPHLHTSPFTRCAQQGF